MKRNEAAQEAAAGGDWEESRGRERERGEGEEEEGEKEGTGSLELSSFVTVSD